MTLIFTALTAAHADQVTRATIGSRVKRDPRLRLSMLGNVITVHGCDEALDAFSRGVAVDRMHSFHGLDGKLTP